MLIKYVASYLLNIAILVRRLCSSIALCGGKRPVNFDLLNLITLATYLKPNINSSA